MIPPSDAFTVAFDVEPEHLDQLDHVNNVVYLSWVQDVAIAHWSELASDDLQSTMFWVVVRHEIDYLRSLVLGDGVEVTTWVGGEVNGFFERFTQVRRQRDRRVAVEAVTLWCPMSMSDGRRLHDVPAEVHDLFARVSVPDPA